MAAPPTAPPATTPPPCPDTRYSLWAVPRDAAPWAALIAHLSTAHGLTNFPPHVTLVGDVGGLADAEDAAERGARVAATAPAPLRVRVRHVGWSAATYRCVYALADATPTLTALHGAALHAFGVAEEPAGYMPHISLAYAPPSQLPVEARAHVAAGVAGAVEAAGGGDGGDGIALSRVELWDTTGPHEGWRRVRAWDLGGDGAGGQGSA